MRRLFLLLSFVLACTLLYAQDETEEFVADTVTYDEDSDGYDGYQLDSVRESRRSYTTDPINPAELESTKEYLNEDIEGNRFNDEKWKDLVGEMNYDEDPEKKKKPEKKKESSGPWFTLSPELLRTVSFILVFVLFAFILYYVSKNTTLAERISKLKPTDMSAPGENIEDFDSDSLLKQALAGNDLRLAIRIRYLMLLKKLNEVGLISWKKDKTNRDYLSELYGRNACYDNVRDLTLAYELVWYGERSVNSDSFQRLTGEFENVNRQITEVRPSA